MKNKSVLFTILFFVSAALAAQDFSAIHNYIKDKSETDLLKHSQWALYAKYLDSGKEIVNHNGEMSVAPASGLKVFTSTAALGILGEDYRFETKVVYSGNLTSEGVLEGDIYIIGGGDPTLGSDRVEGSMDLNQLMVSWAKKIKEAGIKVVKGSVIADDHRYSSKVLPDNWYWVDMGNYYGAGVNGLTIHDNLYHLYFEPADKVGDKAKVLRTEPEIPNLKFVNEMETGKKGSGDNGYIYAAPRQYNAYLRGSIPAGVKEFFIKGAIPDPAQFAAEYLTKVCGENGIEIVGEPRKIGEEVKYSDAKEIAIVKSPTVSEIVYIVNKRSFNLYTEHLLREIGLVKNGEASVSAGVKALTDFLESKGVNTAGLLLSDGCGLSRSDAITPKMMVDLLAMNTKQDYFKSFDNSLCPFGVSGDIGHYANVGLGTLLENNARIKSGSISLVRSYSGYLKDRKGRTIVFSLIANNFDGSAGMIGKIHREIMVKLAELN